MSGLVQSIRAVLIDWWENLEMADAYDGTLGNSPIPESLRGVPQSLSCDCLSDPRYGWVTQPCPVHASTEDLRREAERLRVRVAHLEDLLRRAQRLLDVVDLDAPEDLADLEAIDSEVLP